MRAYNQTWDYFSGMSEADIERHIRLDTTWQRPTWPFSGLVPSVSEDRVRCNGGLTSSPQPLKNSKRRIFFDDELVHPASRPTPEFSRGDALAAPSRHTDLAQRIEREYSPGRPRRSASARSLDAYSGLRSAGAGGSGST